MTRAQRPATRASRRAPGTTKNAGHVNRACTGSPDLAGQIREDVLHSSKYPTASFRSSQVIARADGGCDLTGELTLHGVKRPLQAQTQLVAGKQQLEVTLHQPDFGITPYKAMLGALKVQPDVKVRIQL